MFIVSQFLILILISILKFYESSERRVWETEAPPLLGAVNKYSSFIASDHQKVNQVDTDFERILDETCEVPTREVWGHTHRTRRRRAPEEKSSHNEEARLWHL